MNIFKKLLVPLVLVGMLVSCGGSPASESVSEEPSEVGVRTWTAKEKLFQEKFLTFVLPELGLPDDETTVVETQSLDEYYYGLGYIKVTFAEELYASVCAALEAVESIGEASSIDDDGATYIYTAGDDGEFTAPIYVEAVGTLEAYSYTLYESGFRYYMNYNIMTNQGARVTNKTFDQVWPGFPTLTSNDELECAYYAFNWFNSSNYATIVGVQDSTQAQCDSFGAAAEEAGWKIYHWAYSGGSGYNDHWYTKAGADGAFFFEYSEDRTETQMYFLAGYSNSKYVEDDPAWESAESVSE